MTDQEGKVASATPETEAAAPAASPASSSPTTSTTSTSDVQKAPKQHSPHHIAIVISVPVILALMVARFLRATQPQELQEVDTTSWTQLLARWMLRGVGHVLSSMGGMVVSVFTGTVAVGLGLGVATHVYDTLDVWQQYLLREQQQDNKPSAFSASAAGESSAGLGSPSVSRTFLSRTNTPAAIGSMSEVQDSTSYVSLLQTAGYTVQRSKAATAAPLIQRGQVLNAATARAWQVEAPHYNYVVPDPTATIPPAVQNNSEWGRIFVQDATIRPLAATLPPAIAVQLGRLMDFVVRDFVAVWYTSLDAGCQTAEAENNPSSSSSRTMVFSTAAARRIPFVDQVYTSLAVVLGNLCTRAEDLNVMSVILLQWTKVLAHTFKVYRALRKNVLVKEQASRANQHHVSSSTGGATSSSNSQQQQASRQTQRRSRRGGDDLAESGSSNHSRHSSRNAGISISNHGHRHHSKHGHNHQQTLTPVSEMAMAREFFLMGKVHRALTFGLDVPSLLFSDAAGKDCGTGTNDKSTGEADDDLTNRSTKSSTIIATKSVEDQVLEERLFGTPLLRECEVDYNRVVASRMVRALLSRSDYGCPVVSSLLTELMASSVLTPIMTCFCPEYLNGWIIQGMSKGEDGNGHTSATNEEENDRSANTPQQARNDSTPRSSNVDLDDAQAVSVADEEEENTTQGDRSSNALACASETTAAVAATQAAKTTSENGNSDVKTGDSSSSPPVPPEGLAAASTSAVSEDKDKDDILALLTLCLIELQRYMDFDELRQRTVETSQEGKDNAVDWDSDGCRAAVLRLVLVIEAALAQGRCTYKYPTTLNSADVQKEEIPAPSDIDDAITDQEDEMEDVLDVSERPVEMTLSDYESVTLSQMLMEMTSDVEAFEERVATENIAAADRELDPECAPIAEEYKPSPTEQSTLRTLIAAWLHTGQIYRILTVLVQAQETVLSPYYDQAAFLRSPSSAPDFVRQLKALDGVEILVDTMTVLASPRLDETSGDELRALAKSSAVKSGQAVARGTPDQVSPSTKTAMAAQFMSSSSTPRHLDYHRNDAFASSLRSERERRTQSWAALVYNDDSEALSMVCRMKGGTEEDRLKHKELHDMAKTFYNGTNLVAIRDYSRKRSKGSDAASQSETTAGSDPIHTSLLTIENAGGRRRIEVPDDDSSFLLRAQQRQIEAVGVHRDSRNHDLSYRKFAATYEEPAVAPGTDHYSGGRYVRRCFIRYYPSDRTASVELLDDMRKVDQRTSKSSMIPETITVGGSSRPTPFISAEFLRERHLCNKWIPKGTTRPQSMLATTIMEQTDFTSMPRPGKAIDYVYRMTFFERPMVDLSGKRFTIRESTFSGGPHRADASAMEVSDASLSAALLMMGDVERDETGNPVRRNVELGRDGYPILWMRPSRKKEDTNIGMKPYRVSFVRAALLVTTARQEAQHQCLCKCVRAGSAKSATKALTDARLKPAAKLLEYAGSNRREKESLLLRDLKLGVNHIDREQLRRNGLLSPRWPTSITDISVHVEDVVQAKDITGVKLFGATGTLYKIRCVATVELIADDEEIEGVGCYIAEDGSVAATLREEWVVYRPFKDFQTMHKHMKNEVSPLESSGTTGSRLVGAATAAFASGSLQGKPRRRDVLIPSLSHATKAVSLGATQRSLMKRREYLDGYLRYLLSPDNLLSHSPEILLFVGAFYPLPSDIGKGVTVSSIVDPLGRTEMSRDIVSKRRELDETNQPNNEDELDPSAAATPRKRATSSASLVSGDGKDDDDIDDSEDVPSKLHKSDMIPAIRNKIDKVPLSQVRSRIFELLRFQFGFENASFIRNRMLAALKTVSFAVTSPGEFRRTLYRLHTEYISADAIAGWIEFGVNKLWPNGVFFVPAPPTPADELERLSNKAKEVLHASFPEQVRAILGQDLTRDGLNIFHEMLQNRVVVKSMSYMLFDLLWLEVFPEIGDVLECGAALDIESDHR